MQELLSTSPIMSTITNRHQTTSTPLNDDQSSKQPIINDESANNLNENNSQNIDSTKTEQNIFNTYKNVYYNNSAPANNVSTAYTNFSVNNLTGTDSASLQRSNLNWRSTPPSAITKTDSDYYSQAQYVPKDTNRSSIFSTIASSSLKNDAPISDFSANHNNNGYDYQFSYKPNLAEATSTTFSNENAYPNSAYYAYNTNPYASNSNIYNQFQLPVQPANGNGSNLFRYDSASSTSSSSSGSLLNHLSPINLKNKLEQNNDINKKIKLSPASPTQNVNSAKIENGLNSNGANMVMSHYNSASSSSSFTSSPSSLSSASNKNSNSSLSPKIEALTTSSGNSSAFTNLSSTNSSSKMVNNNNLNHATNISSTSSSSPGNNFSSTNQIGSLGVETFEWMKPIKSASNGKL